MPGIFISYRRADSPDATGRVYDRLVAEFGRVQVFKDIDSIPLGRDFRSHLNEMIGDCAAVLAIIGPHWADAHDESGKRRLEDADDFVRIELEAALARNIPVVPVLVSHAVMPTTAQLPESLAPLAYRQSIEVRPDPDFHHDATRLVTALRAMLDPEAAALSAAALNEDPQGAGSTMRAMAGPSRKAWRLVVSAAIATTAAAIALLVPALRHLRETPPPETRVDIVTPAAGSPSSFALSPDGRQIVFTSAAGDGQSRLWLRSLANTTAQPLAGSEGARAPFWSPDGRSVGFLTAGALKRLDLGAGAPRTLAPAITSRGGTWNQEDVILFASVPNSTITRVSATGGEVSAVTTLGAQQTGHVYPHFLPDGNRFLFHVLGSPETAGIYLGALDGRAPVRLTAADSPGVYLAPGWLLWKRRGVLVAQRLELAKPALTGGLLTLASDFEPDESGIASVSSTGLVAYRPAVGNRRQLVWFDRSGTARGTFAGAESSGAGGPKISPDGRRVVVFRDGDLWLLDGTRSTRFTFDANVISLRGIWSPDGGQIAWADSAGINRKPASGAGATERIAPISQSLALDSWSTDGRYLLYHTVDAVTGGDLWVLPTSGPSTPAELLRTRFDERSAILSPDGRWLAYYSSESGRYEVYVRPFMPPGSPGAMPVASSSGWQVSTKGGVFPAWRPDSKELYYLNPAGAMMAVPVTVAGSRFEPGVPAELFLTHIVGGGAGNLAVRNYDVGPDGRFLINTVLDDAGGSSITLLMNWSPDSQVKQ